MIVRISAMGKPHILAASLAVLIASAAGPVRGAEMSMVGIWYSAFQPDEPGVMSLIEFEADGSFNEEFRKCEKGEVVGAYFESGKWSLKDGIERITIEKINGDPTRVEDMYTVELLTETERRIRLEKQNLTFTSRRVAKFEFPDCATGT